MIFPGFRKHFYKYRRIPDNVIDGAITNNIYEEVEWYKATPVIVILIMTICIILIVITESSNHNNLRISHNESSDQNIQFILTGTNFTFPKKNCENCNETNFVFCDAKILNNNKYCYYELNNSNLFFSNVTFCQQDKIINGTYNNITSECNDNLFLKSTNMMNHIPTTFSIST